MLAGSERRASMKGACLSALVCGWFFGIADITTDQFLRAVCVCVGGELKGKSFAELSCRKCFSVSSQIHRLETYPSPILLLICRWDFKSCLGGE